MLGVSELIKIPAISVHEKNMRNYGTNNLLGFYILAYHKMRRRSEEPLYTD